jgi:predicted small metal-binding protein
MAKVVRCRDAGSDCDFVVRADTEEEVMELVAEHAKAVHNLEISEELSTLIRSLIKDE